MHQDVLILIIFKKIYQLLEWEENEDTFEEETDRLHTLLRIITILLGRDVIARLISSFAKVLMFLSRKTK